MSDALGYYRILEVYEDTNAEIIKKNYRDLAKKWHPDHNTAEDAIEKFQLLAKAYEVLSDEESRLYYDLLSEVYGEKNYPELENISPYAEGTAEIRALWLNKVRGMIWKYRAEKELKICGFRPALQARMLGSLENWLLGWWHPKAFMKNIRVLAEDWKSPLSEQESLRVLVHNVVAYQKQGKPDLAVTSAIQALDYAGERLKGLLQGYIRSQKLRVSRPRPWNLAALRAVQLIVPMVIVAAALVPFGSGYMSESELWNWFSKKQEIDYYQEVRFGGESRSVDDVVVGKILSIPVDKSDISKLYHLQTAAKVMYGPGEDFDVLKELPAQTTVRLTGKTPDNAWSRVMIDNGEMGFVRGEVLEQGIGAEIPYGSEIFRQ